jgi:dTDP-glucose pyrophosphorylase
LKKYHYKATIVNQFKILGGKEKIYGTACPLMCVKEIIGRENFLAVYGDNLYSVKDLKAMRIKDNYNYVAGLIHPHPEKYGILISDDGFLKKIIEKPSPSQIYEINLGGQVGNLINTGLYKFTPEVFKKISLIKKSPRGEYELTDVITLLAKERKVKVKKIQDYWIDFGNPADIMRLSKFIKSSKNFK